jgi:hypothetical protein
VEVADTFTVGGSGTGQVSATIGRIGLVGVGVEWGVPAVVLGVPGLLLIIVVMAQSLGGLAWLPIVRRRIGGFGLGLGRSGQRGQV